MKGLLRPFWCSICGLMAALRMERHMRIHLTAVVLVSYTAIFYRATAGEWLALFLCFGFVISAELMNTAIEKLADVCEPNYSPAIKLVKDAAAAGVLVAALASVAVAIVVFGDGVRLSALLHRPIVLAVFGVLALAGACFVFMDCLGSGRGKRNE